MTSVSSKSSRIVFHRYGLLVLALYEVIVCSKYFMFSGLSVEASERLSKDFFLVISDGWIVEGEIHDSGWKGVDMLLSEGITPTLDIGLRGLIYKFLAFRY